MWGTSEQRGGRSAIPGSTNRSDGIDLDALAGAYVHRPLSDAARRRALAAVAGLEEGAVALDVGGGTGMHAALWAERGAAAIVADPSRSMLAAAAEQPGVSVVCCRAQRLPFRDATCALAYFHLSLHYGDWRASLAEAWRVLRPGGHLRIWTLGADHHAQALIHRYFPQLLAIDLERFPEPDAVVGHLEALGGAPSAAAATETKRMLAGAWEAAVRARFISTLQHLTDDHIERGLEAFRHDHPDPEGPVEYQLLWTGLVAVR